MRRKMTAGAAAALCLCFVACSPEPAVTAQWQANPGPQELAHVQAAASAALAEGPARLQQIKVDAAGTVHVHLAPETLTPAQVDDAVAKLAKATALPDSEVTLTVPPPVKKELAQMSMIDRVKASAEAPVGSYRATIQWPGARVKVVSRPGFMNIGGAGEMKRVGCELELPLSDKWPDLRVRREMKLLTPADLADTPYAALSPADQERALKAQNSLRETFNSVLRRMVIVHDHSLVFADEAIKQDKEHPFVSNGEGGLTLDLGEVEGAYSLGGYSLGEHQGACDKLLATKRPEVAQRMQDADRLGGLNGWSRNPRWQPKAAGA